MEKDEKFTVKEVEGVEKSTVEIEESLLAAHEAKANQDEVIDKTVGDVAPIIETPASELNDENVLSYIREKYDKDIESVDKLFEKQAPLEAQEELPEDVSAYYKYKKETGRGIEDFVKLQRNFDDMDSEKLLTQYYSETEEGLDGEDIKDLIEEKFGFDTDLDEPKDIKKSERAKKRELVKAKNFFNEQKEKYKLPLESSGKSFSKGTDEEFNSYKSYVEESNTTKEAQQKKYDYFLEKTDEVFNDEFKGFEFSVGEKSFTFKPGDKDELKGKQSDVNNFVNKFMDKESGLINDAQGYHRALSVAMNLDKFAEFFFNQGMTDTIDRNVRQAKNINMDVRQSPQNFSKDGLKIRAIGDTSSGSGLKIRSAKKL